MTAPASSLAPDLNAVPFVRQAAVAGRFYCADGSRLAGEVAHFLTAERAPALANVTALVAPHAGYPCSGAVAGAAYRVLPHRPPHLPTTPPTVYLLGPAHWKQVHGIALSSAEAFATPLGPVPVAVDRVRQLAAMGGQYRIDDTAHAPEHCLEVQLPFLQTVVPGLRIVPLLFDDAADPEAAARELAVLLEDSSGDLVVVSTDLSHYHPYQDAIILDHGLLKALATGDFAAANAGEACGLLPLLCLMRLAEHFQWQPHLLAYANSGDTCGSHREVVGYGAIGYTHA